MLQMVTPWISKFVAEYVYNSFHELIKIAFLHSHSKESVKILPHVMITLLFSLMSYFTELHSLF